jgi:predicted acylesterase/phospholipase RssA
MKGGITSGVVYPLVLVSLAKDYCFSSIGGTSAGAMAAAAAAALRPCLAAPPDKQAATPRRPRTPIGESYSLGLLLGFTFLAGCFFLAVSGATGVGASLSMFGELLGGTVPEGSAFNACDG